VLIAFLFHNSTRNIVVTQGDKLTSKRYRLLLLLCSFLSVFYLHWSVSFLCVFLLVLRDPRFGNLANLKPIYPRQLLLSIGDEPSEACTFSQSVQCWLVEVSGMVRCVCCLPHFHILGRFISPASQWP